MYKRKAKRWPSLSRGEKEKIVYDFLLIELAIKNICPDTAARLCAYSIFGRTGLDERIFQEISTKYNISIHQVEAVVRKEFNQDISDDRMQSLEIA